MPEPTGSAVPGPYPQGAEQISMSEKNRQRAYVAFMRVAIVGLIGFLAYAIAAGVEAGIKAQGSDQGFGWKMCFLQIIRVFGSGVMLGSASLVCGAMIGFLFHIPRVSSRPQTGAAHGEPGPIAQNDGAAGIRASETSNLQKVADWLTNIIVGIGLVELKAMPGHLKSFGEFLGPLMGTEVHSKLSAILILLYALALGFFVGYLFSRLFVDPAVSEVGNRGNVT